MKSEDQSGCGWRCVMAVVILITASGCKREEADRGREPGAPLSPEIAAARDAIVSGMQAVAFDELARGHIGSECVVTAHTPPAGPSIDPPPPPLGMVRRLGQTVAIYRGQIESISGGGLTIRAPYPKSDQSKSIEVLRASIESVHVAR